MKILVTGSTGFVGRNLIPSLLINRVSILEITRDIEKSKRLYGGDTEKYLLTDDQSMFTKRVETFGPDIVVHLASYLTPDDDYNSLQDLLNSNIVFFCRLLDTLKKVKLELFVNTGTFAEYSLGDGSLDPAYLYSATKSASRAFLDYYSKRYNFNQITIIPYTIYGAKDSQKKIIDIIFDSINSHIPIQLTAGEQILDFIHIDDICSFYVNVIQNFKNLPKKSNVHLGTGEGHSIKQLAAIIEQATRKVTNINWGAKAYRQTDIMYAVANPNFNTVKIDWRPSINLEEGVKSYLKVNEQIF